jgi:D-arabinose 1-dehydrogenase-like Zn-dependent alcohol dehydrogenase
MFRKPDLAEGEALPRVEVCGFCGSDLGIVAGVHPRAREPLTLGHEFSGIIEETLSPGSDLKPGERASRAGAFASSGGAIRTSAEIPSSAGEIVENSA